MNVAASLSWQIISYCSVCSIIYELQLKKMVIITESPLQQFVTNCTFTAICDASRLTMQIKICYRIKICDSFSDRAMQNATTPFLILERRAIIEINIRDTQMTICTLLNWFACLLAPFIRSLCNCTFPRCMHCTHFWLSFELHCHNFIDANSIILLSWMGEFTLALLTSVSSDKANPSHSVQIVSFHKQLELSHFQIILLFCSFAAVNWCACACWLISSFLLSSLKYVNNMYERFDVRTNERQTVCGVFLYVTDKLTMTFFLTIFHSFIIHMSLGCNYFAHHQSKQWWAYVSIWSDLLNIHLFAVLFALFVCSLFCIIPDHTQYYLW